MSKKNKSGHNDEPVNREVINQLKKELYFEYVLIRTHMLTDHDKALMELLHNDPYIQSIRN